MSNIHNNNSNNRNDNDVISKNPVKQRYLQALQSFDLAVVTKDCGQQPTIHSYDAVEQQTAHALFDYSLCEPSIDQQQINQYLAQQPTRGRQILHIGTGNSSVATLCRDADCVISATVAENEKHHGDSLAYDNYQILFVNKYSDTFATQLKDYRFDYIVDNNIASFACCQHHFLSYMAAIVECLTDNGQLLTHWLGMQWILDLGINDTESCWRLDEAKLTHIADCFGLNVERQQQLFILTKRPQCKGQ